MIDRYVPKGTKNPESFCHLKYRTQKLHPDNRKSLGAKLDLAVELPHCLSLN